MSEELKNCPFCESRAEHYSFNHRKHTVRCAFCLADCGEHNTPERAAFVWNTRPEEERLKAENEALFRHVTGLTAWLKAMEDAYEELFKKNVPEKIVVIK